MARLYRITAVVVVAAAVGVGAFFAGRETAPPTTTSSTTTAPPSTTTTTTAAPTTTSTTPPSTAVLTICQPSQLRISAPGFSGAMGTIERTFSLTNISSGPCDLDGFPGLLLLGPGGTAEPTNALRGGTLAFEAIAPSRVTLAPGDTGYFNIGYSDVTTNGTTCTTATAVQVIPPTDTAHAIVAVEPRIDACDNGALHESAVFSSTNGAATKTTAPSN